MGGAQSHDIQDGILEPAAPDFHERRSELRRRYAYYRINHISWWKEELPSEEEYQTALASLDASGWKVDYVVSHCCPTSIADIIGGGEYQPDKLTDFFERVKNRLDFEYWFFGHYHDNRTFGWQFVLLYEKIKVVA